MSHRVLGGEDPNLFKVFEAGFEHGVELRDGLYKHFLADDPPVDLLQEDTPFDKVDAILQSLRDPADVGVDVVREGVTLATVAADGKHPRGPLLAPGPLLQTVSAAPVGFGLVATTP